MMTDLRKTVEALLVLRDQGLIDDKAFASMTAGAANGQFAPVERKDVKPGRIERNVYPTRERFERNGVRLPAGACTVVLLWLAQHAGTAYSAGAVARGVGITKDRISTVGSALTKMKGLGLVDHDVYSRTWTVNDAGMGMAAAYQAAH